MWEMLIPHFRLHFLSPSISKNMHHLEILTETFEWFISLHWRWVDNSYQQSWAHLVSPFFCKACETDRWFREWYKKSSSKDTEKMGGPAWADSLFTTWLTSLPIRCMPGPTNMLTHKQHMVRFQVELLPDHRMMRFCIALYASLHQSARSSIAWWS